MVRGNLGNSEYVHFQENKNFSRFLRYFQGYLDNFEKT